MLVCFVCAEKRRAQIVAEIVETADAVVDVVSDAGFLLLVDAPAAATATADAFLGEFLSEAASANDTIQAGLFYTVLIDEPANVADSFTGIYAAGIDVDVAEAATAASLQNATLTVSRSAMVFGLEPVFVNPTTSREADVGGVMVNL